MTYEYLVGGFPPDSTPNQQQARLNALGAEGWELVSVYFQPAIHRGQNYVMFYLKRPKSDKPVPEEIKDSEMLP
jgi:hypothetical protein